VAPRLRGSSTYQHNAHLATNPTPHHRLKGPKSEGSTVKYFLAALWIPTGGLNGTRCILYRSEFNLPYALLSCIIHPNGHFFRWGNCRYYTPATSIQGQGDPRCTCICTLYIHISITTPIAPALKNYHTAPGAFYCIIEAEAPTDILNHFWIQVAISEAKRDGRYVTVLVLEKKRLQVYNGYSIPMAVIQVGPPGYFTHISITTPIVSALKNYYR
jgi:hypothetical protein